MENEERSLRERVLFHVDMDSFFASVEVRCNPRLRGKPVIVGGRPDSRSVVASASYEARKYGVRSAMPTVQARRLCPRGIFLEGNPKKYVWYSNLIQRILIDFTPRVEPFSIDEAFLEFPFSWTQPERIRRQGELIRQTIRERLGLAATVGIAPNKMLAKLASNAAKPDGLKIIPPEEVDQFLISLPVGKLWGVGERTQASLHRLGIHRVNDLRKWSQERLRACFGAWGENLYAMAWGVDETPLRPYYEEEPAKSLGHEETFERDVTDERKILAHLMELSEKVACRLRKNHYLCRLVTVKRKYPDLSLQTRCQLLAWPTQLELDIYLSARQALGKFQPPGRPIRLLGISAGRLVRESEAREQLLMKPLFEGDFQITDLMDRIRSKYSPDIIHRARSGDILSDDR